MRRLAAYIVDIALLAAPWSAILGVVGLEALAGTMLTSAASLALLIVDVVLFLRRGRTLGMATAGLVATEGSRGLALLLGPVGLALGGGVGYFMSNALVRAEVIGEDHGPPMLTALLTLAVVAANLLFLVGPRRRTLLDRLSGMQVVRDPTVAALGAGLRPGLTVIDGVVGVCIAAPWLVVLGHAPGPRALASLAGLAAFCVLEMVLWKRSGATLGGRAWARPQ